MSEASSTPGGQPPLITRDFLLLIGGHLLQALGYASMPLLPLYLDHLGASRTEIGVIMAEAAVGGLLSRPAVGWALDVIGRRRTLIAGTALVAGGAAGVGLVTEVGPLLHALRILFGIGIGILFTGYFTLAADIVPGQRRTEGLAIFGISGLVPLAINPLVGSLDLHPAELRGVFPLVGVVVAASLAALVLLRGPRHEGGATEQYHPMAAIRALRQFSLWPVWLVTVVFSVPVAVFLAFANVAAVARGLDNPGTLWLTFAGGATLVRLFGARLPQRLGEHNMVAPALAMYVMGLVMMGRAGSATGFLVAGLLGGLGHGYGFPVIVSQVVERAPRRVRGTAMATYTALFDLSLLIATPVFGRVADSRDDATMFAAAAVFVTAGLGMWAALEHRVAGRAAGAQTETGSDARPGRHSRRL